MAAKIPPPRELNLDNNANISEAWRRWKREFEFFLVATEIDKKADKIKTSTLLSCIGQRSREIYYNFIFESDEDSMKYDTVIERFDAHFCPKSNITFLRFKFFNVKQDENQPVDDFINELKTKAQDCEFKELTDSLIRDRIVCGVSNMKLQERLLREPELTLDRAIHLCKADEDTRKQTDEIQKHAIQSDTKVGSVKVKQKYKNRSHNNQARNSSQYEQKVKTKYSKKNKESKSKSCRFCGKVHERGQCPAYGKACSACGRLNHFAAVCLTSKRVKTVHVEKESESTESEDNEFFIGSVKVESGTNISDCDPGKDNENTCKSNDKELNTSNTEYFVNTISSDIDHSKDWILPLQTSGTEISYKLDTGAQCNIISRKIYNSLPNKPKLHKAKEKLTSYDGGNIEIVGKCIVRITKSGSSGKSYPVQCFVVPTESPPILGLETCKRLGLIKRVMVVNPATPDYMHDYDDVFGEIGVLNGEHHINLDPTVPPVINSPRRIPFGLKEKVKIELDRMEKLQIISKIEKPTEWVNSIVVVEKPNGNIRICLDPKNLNEAILREHFPMQTADDIIADMAGAKYFTKLDASSGYWQIKLDEPSSELLTFQTPFGRYKFNRLAFGVKSASEVFQRKISEIIEGLEGCKNNQDDIIVWGESQEEHDERLKAVLDRIRKANLKLNREKCVFCVQELTFLGHTLTVNGVKPDETKVRAVLEMPVPENKADLRRFMGMITYLGKFLPNLSSVSAPLRQLLQEDVEWSWTEQHDLAVDIIKKLITQSPVLKYFDPKLETKISVDASKTGLGAVLLQKHDNDWFPIAYASRAMTSSEINYAQIEKETLAIVFGTDRFHDYLYGKKFTVESDHKPLQPIFTKSISKAPPRIQRFLLRLQRYDFDVEFTPGKYLYIADTLSRAYLPEVLQAEIPEVEYQVHCVVSNLPISVAKFEEFKAETLKDPVLQEVTSLIRNGWPSSFSECSPEIKPYYHIKEELSVVDGIILKVDKVVVPSSMRRDMLKRIHEGHIGIEKCKARARDVMYWPRINAEIEDFISKCSVCLQHSNRHQKEPLISHDIPFSAWDKVGTDLFHCLGQDYLIVVDYFSNFPEVCLLQDTQSATIIRHMKSVFARHGIPRTIVSDNGPQYSSLIFQQFCKEYDIEHITGSPEHPKSNGLAENSVKIIKKLLKKAKKANEDPYLALLSYRSTPTANGLPSPAERIFGRKIRSRLPSFKPLVKTEHLSLKLQENKVKQKLYYDKNSKDLSKLSTGATVRIRQGDKKEWSTKCKVVSNTKLPRSYIVETTTGKRLRRNRKDLLLTSEKFDLEVDADVDPVANDGNVCPNSISKETPIEQQQQSKQTNEKHYVTRSGRISKPPLRYTS